MRGKERSRIFDCKKRTPYGLGFVAEEGSVCGGVQEGSHTKEIPATATPRALRPPQKVCNPLKP